jgi:molybdate transport system substrate-binding protein
MGSAMDGLIVSLPVRMLAAAAFVSAMSVGAARAAELNVLSGGAMRAAVSELAATFENVSNHKLVIRYGTVAKIAEQIASDEPVDVAILSDPLFGTLVRAGKIVGGTTTRLAHVPIALAVKSGMTKPEIGSVQALRKTLLDAASITYGDPAMGDAAGVHMARVIENLGLAAEMKPKTRLISPPAGQSGAQFLSGMFQRGEIGVAIAPISVLMEAKGGDIVGLLPAELQTADLTFFAGVPSTCRHPFEAKTLIDFLAGPLAKPVYRAKGMDPG